MLSLDLDVTYLIVLALILFPLAILNGVVFGPFLRLFEQRHEKLEGALERAQTTLEQAEAQAKSFEEKMRVAASKGIDLRNKIRTDAARETGERIEVERKRLAVRVEQALAEVAATRQQSLAGAQVQAQRMAELAAQKLLGRGL